MITVEIPTLLRRYTHEQRAIELTIALPVTLLATIMQLTKEYPALSNYLLTSDNQLAGFVSFYINGKDARALSGDKTLLHKSDIVSIILAIAGG